MPGSPNKLSQFWQELKRRKVTRTITVYAAAAFVTLELVSIIVEPLKLPEWTLPFIIVLLCVGFIIAIILSWIYDIHPEGGIVKTEPVNKVKPREERAGSNSWKIASYISFVVIAALIALNIVPRADNKKETLEKSIAVLPFINDSPDEENTYFINGIMEEILLNLQAIKDFQVPGRTSVESYRNQSKSVPEIAKELGVNYIIEGSGQKYGNTIRLYIQLLEGANGMHLWGESYDEQINNPEDILRIQSRIAKSIAEELKTVITPQEQELIERPTTSSLTAYDFFLRGREEHLKYGIDKSNTRALARAEQLYHAALEQDPSYARAYAGLAMAYWDKHYWDAYFTENFLDSVLIFTDMALALDDKLAEIHSLKGDYYQEMGNYPRALDEYETALDLNPNDWQAYEGAGNLYFGQKNFERAFENKHMAVNLNHDLELPRLMRSLGRSYFVRRFPEKYRYYVEEAFRLDGDSLPYLNGMFNIEVYTNDNYTEAIEIGKRGYRIDSNSVRILEQLAWAYELNGQFDISLDYRLKLKDRLEDMPLFRHNNMHHLGYCYWKLGRNKEAEYWFDLQKKYCEEAIKFNREYAIVGSASYDLACVYAFRGDKVKAYEYLHLYNKMIDDRTESIYGWFLERDPFFDGMRDEPEFQQIVKDVEAKYQAEHERVRKWLEENDML